MGNDRDVIDRMIADWQRVRPDLDASPLAVVGRVIVLARRLEKSVEAALKDHGLTLGQFDVLATLRRHDHDGGLSPTQLWKNLMLSSGTMTSHIDRLEDAKLIARQADPNDRRGVVVVLTARGRKVIDAATATRFQEASASLPNLTPAEMAKLEASLRTWLAAYS